MEELTVKKKTPSPLFFLLAACGIYGVAFAASSRSPSNQAGNDAQAAAPAAISDKAAKKISKAIGEEIGDFSVIAQEEVDAPVGYKGTEYTVTTSGGKKFKCEIMESSKAGRIMTLGMGAGADALCTEFASAGKGKPKPANRAAVASKPPAAGGTTSPQAAPAAISDKAAKKISKAIGEEIGDFSVIAQEEVDAPVGYTGTEYTVTTSGGKKFKCEIMESSKGGRIMTLGMGAGADALCTEFASAGKGKPSPGNRAAVASKPPAAGGTTSPQAAPAAISDKTAKKISKAIGEEVGDFSVIAQEEVDAPVGYTGTEYTVTTSGGKKFKCEIMESSKAGRIMTLGMGAGADALCTDFTKGSKDKGKTNSASCNALLRAAGKCS